MGNMSAFLHNPGFWVGLATVLVVALLLKLLIPVITKALDKRSLQIAEELERAVALREEAQLILARYQKKQRESMKEADEIIQKANLEARRITKEAEEQMEAQLQKRMKLAMEKIELAEKRALDDVQHHTVQVAIAAARELLASKLDETTRKALVDNGIANLQQKLH